jgi:hypothetical protein
MKKKHNPSSKAETKPSAAHQASPQRTRLLASLESSIKRVDEEGLLFLLRQAQVLIRNAEVDRLNWEAEELSKKTKKKPAAVKAPTGSSQAAVEESSDGKAVFLVLGNTRKVMTVAEIRQLVKICWSAESKSAALRQMFNVFAKERRDILIDAGIGGAQHPLLESLFHAVRAAYRLKEE